MTNRQLAFQGELVRIVDDSIAYAYLRDYDRTMSFIPAVIDAYRGESFAELGFSVGTLVDLESQSKTGVVTRVRRTPVSSGTKETVRRSGETLLPNRSSQVAHGAARREGTILPNVISLSGTGTAQRELHPDRPVTGRTAALRALPKATRAFGKLVDTSALAPGDLMLSRELKPERISQLITTVQERGGYHIDDAIWTHAAMYVGDGANLVEATFDSVQAGGDVRLTSLDEYCQGNYALRFRRSRFIPDSQFGWRVCVRALSRLKKPYDFLNAARMWFDVVIRGGGFFDDDRRYPLSKAVICSTLYADSYNEATRRVLGEVSGACVPAWLSVSDEFDDLQPEWLSIGR
jgi:hypothetical protein